MDIRKLKEYEKDETFSRVNSPLQLSHREKDELLFALMEQLKLGVFRNIYHSRHIVLAPLEE